MLNEAPMDNDSLLIQQFKEGNEEAFNKIYYQFSHSLYYFAETLIKNREQSQEIVNDSFIKLHTRCSHFDTIPNIKAFLNLTVRNACFDWLKGKKVENKRFGRKVEIFDDIHAYDTYESELASIQSETIDRIFEEAKALPPVCRKIFRMHYIDGKKLTAIAKELGLKKGTIRTQLNVAVRKLKGSHKLLTLMLFSKLILFFL
ncbi:hypothetical protein A4H97_29965 [Niastella yeongjuensis]|uniref:HTH luxR-type domain-containing protein n=1 Tax=Niastella yeongjuensis TaxID=354355 RepID=A0A1V9EPP9_9BACT|nr:sigma-70 family RNA polymerase sigma factor [Niastella yeongjuensis]OQP48061.1 hypothetical protein A4H97_29965 [Niastella yeongjuensis]SEO25275.1 RNA polymerase sigma-70 factor, ECF subfamily [Niastella yeongjuensis]